ncbi:hypothetical protein C8J56DRAFT_890975 [Mycena floridula]|nr:hypothetical protein C8J56DRAFT_890975 [Mycena floridula]
MATRASLFQCSFRYRSSADFILDQSAHILLNINLHLIREDDQTLVESISLNDVEVERKDFISQSNHSIVVSIPTVINLAQFTTNQRLYFREQSQLALILQGRGLYKSAVLHTQGALPNTMATLSDSLCQYQPRGRLANFGPVSTKYQRHVGVDVSKDIAVYPVGEQPGIYTVSMYFKVPYFGIRPFFPPTPTFETSSTPQSQALISEAGLSGPGMIGQVTASHLIPSFQAASTYPEIWKQCINSDSEEGDEKLLDDSEISTTRASSPTSWPSRSSTLVRIPPSEKLSDGVMKEIKSPTLSTVTPHLIPLPWSSSWPQSQSLSQVLSASNPSYAPAVQAPVTAPGMPQASRVQVIGSICKKICKDHSIPYPQTAERESRDSKASLQKLSQSYDNVVRGCREVGFKETYHGTSEPNEVLVTSYGTLTLEEFAFATYGWTANYHQTRYLGLGWARWAVENCQWKYAIPTEKGGEIYRLYQLWLEIQAFWGPDGLAYETLQSKDDIALKQKHITEGKSSLKQLLELKPGARSI